MIAQPENGVSSTLTDENAVKPDGAASSRQSVSDAFKNPSPEFRPWPFLFLNDEYEPGKGEQRLTAQLENLKRVGFGGVFLHPRPGLINEYLSPRWFDLIRHCIAECRRLELIPALYDENSFPSGFAGGHVPALAPEVAVHYVIPKFGDWPESPPGDALAVYHMDQGIPRRLVADVSERSEGMWCAFVLERMRPRQWHGQFPYVSLVDARATKIFLETTHQGYRDALSEEDWNSCAAIFTDEPQLLIGCHGPWRKGMHFTRLIQYEFRRRCGYAIEPVFADLYFDSPTSPATRFDFYETLHDLWVENFARPVLHWCRSNGIFLTGHYLEHDWPMPYATPGHVQLLSLMDWPGSDLLECFLLEGHDHGDPQNFDPSAPGTEPLALYYLHQVQSVANQFSKARVLNECWGAGGHDATPRDWLRIGRYLVVHGVNLLAPHGALTTIRGARKRDYPQFFSEQSPWFDALGPLNEELGRLCWMSARGKMHQRILLIDPLTTGFCLAAKSDCFDEQEFRLGVSRDPGGDRQQSIQPLRRAVTGFVQQLSNAQADFDIGDEYILEESACVKGPRLTLGAQSYELVVLPPGLQNLRSGTLSLLEAFAREGGRIIGIRPLQAWRDGRPDHWPERLAVEWFDTPADLLAGVLRHVPARIELWPEPPAGMAHQRRVSENGVHYLLVNSSPDDWSGTIAVPETGRGRVLLPQTGESRDFNGHLDIAATAAAILVFDHDQSVLPSTLLAVESPPAGEPDETAMATEFLGAELLEPNVLAIDTCALEVGREAFPEQLVYETNRMYWARHGMECNGWSGVIQYRDQILAANDRMPSDSGGVAHYRVYIAPGTAVASIELVWECPEQWNAHVNGSLVKDEPQPWHDWRMGRVRIGRLLREGDNTIDLQASPFDVRQEIDQIYLLGDFVVTNEGPYFALAPTNGSLRLGSWKAQGLPFYERKASYRFRRPSGPGYLRLDANDWYGSVIEVQMGEKRLQAYGPELRFECFDKDPEAFTVTVAGLPYNLWGPWHKHGMQPKTAWATDWHGSGIPNDPQPPAAYRLLDLGLFKPPVFIPQATPPSRTRGSGLVP